MSLRFEVVCVDQKRGTMVSDVLEREEFDCRDEAIAYVARKNAEDGDLGLPRHVKRTRTIRRVGGPDPL